MKLIDSTMAMLAGCCLLLGGALALAGPLLHAWPQGEPGPSGNGGGAAWREWLSEWAFHQADQYFLRGTGEGWLVRVVRPAPAGEATGGGHSHGEARDWLEAFGRHFHAHEHTHMGDADDARRLGRQSREILPWLQLAVELNPQHLESWLLGAHLLRRSLNRHIEAEAFLLEALRHNPNRHDILLPLGQILEEHHGDADGARRAWHGALRDLHHRPGAEEDPGAWRLVVGSLARLEEREGCFEAAMHHLQELRLRSPNPAAVDRWIAEVRQKMGANGGPEPECPAETFKPN